MADLPEPVGCTTRVSKLSTMARTASSCPGRNDSKPSFSRAILAISVFFRRIPAVEMHFGGRNVPAGSRMRMEFDQDCEARSAGLLTGHFVFHEVVADHVQDDQVPILD